ncbi:TOBE domain-containing protein [Limibacter armeniacum]|uniref:TOBE domain-containing protein n=1 Tax=Limibacter armeniacum TaxID=466084 RepID=UPI002FE53856
MNRLSGHITNIRVSGSMSLVTVKVATIELQTIIIETPETAAYLKVDHPIHILFKETEVVIGTDTEHAVSLTNKIKGSLAVIEKGSLLSKLTIESEVGNLIAIISSDAVRQLDLQQNDTVIAMIKLNEIMLSE